MKNILLSIAVGCLINTLSAQDHSINFNGSTDYISIGNSATLLPTTNLTVEAWIKPVVSGHESWAGVFSNLYDTGGDENGYGLFYNGSSSSLMFWVQTVGGGSGGYSSYPSFTPTSGSWQHVAGTYDGVELKLYVNGVLVDDFAKTGDIKYSTPPLDCRIGQYYDNNDTHEYEGEIDEIRVWNTTRTQEEIRSNMTHALVGNETGLVGYWQFDELINNTCAGGEDACDGSTNSNHGTFN